MASKNMKEKALSLRKQIIEKISQEGGYLSSNLSCVEIALALSESFNKKDKIFFCGEDLSLAYELYTGKKAQIRSLTGVIPAIITRELNHEKYHIVIVLNSNYIRSGKDIEALSYISKLDSNLIIIFNDDTLISQGIGMVDKVVSGLRSTKTYNTLKSRVKDAIRPNKHGDKVIEEIHNIKSEVRKMVVDEGIFGTYDIDYQGPIDGNNYDEISKIISLSKQKDYPVAIHCISQSGKGYKYAEASTTEYWYKVNKFNIDTGKPLLNEADGYKFEKHILADEVAKEMLNNKDIVCLSCNCLVQDGVSSIFSHFAKRSFNTINIESLLDLANNFVKEGKIPFFTLTTSEIDRCYDYFKNIFNLNSTMIIGLQKDSKNLSYLKEMDDINLVEIKDYDKFTKQLTKSLKTKKITIFVYEDNILKID